jgi:Protein of unknown function (DUF4231)
LLRVQVCYPERALSRLQATPSPVTLEVVSEAVETMDSATYLHDRVDDQISYFDRSALSNQKRYRLLKYTAIICNVSTTIVIGLALATSERYKIGFAIAALVLSAVVLLTYQWEETANYGAKWEKFRLVAEQLRSERFFFMNRSGPYGSCPDDATRHHLLVESVERLIRGTDIAYFSLMVDPGKRIEKRLESTGAADIRT